MKTLHLIRHAESSGKDASLSNINKPLAPMGIRAYAVMAPEIAKTGCDFSNVFTSPAERAPKTIEKLPTSAYARLELDANSWMDIGLRRMQLTVFLTPKIFR